jgi:hypothetical protein
MSLLIKTMVIVFILIFAMKALNANDSQCRKNCFKLDIEYLIKNHENIYRDNPESFWILLNEMREKAYLADTFNEISQFMELLQMDNSPAEVEEFLSEGLETLCAEKPVLFKEAMQLLDLSLRMKLNEKLNQPLFREKEELRTCRYRSLND